MPKQTHPEKMAKLGGPLLLQILLFHLIRNPNSASGNNQPAVSPSEESFKMPKVNCFISCLLIEGGPELDSTAVVTPIALNSGANSTSREYLSKRLVNLGQSLDRKEKIRHIYCYIGIVSAPIEMYTSGARERLLLEDRFGAVQPDSWILLTYSSPPAWSLMEEVLYGAIFTIIREKALQVPPVRFLTINPDMSSKSCWTLCGEEPVAAFREKCSNLDALKAPRNTEKQGCEMKWGYSKIPGDMYGSSGRGIPFCPFTLGSNRNCSLSSAEGTFKVVIESFNMSMLGLGALNFYPFPTISFGRVWRGRHPFDIEVTGYTGNVCFITSDSVTVAKENNFFKSAGAFQTELWIAIVVTLVSVSLALSLPHGLMFYRFIIPNLCTASGILTDQYTSLARMDRKTCKKALQLIVFTWMIASIVLNNSFKGKVKSNSIIPISYETNWTNLLQLQGFRLFFGYDPVGKVNCTHMDEWLSRRKSHRPHMTFLELARTVKIGFWSLTDFERRATFFLLDALYSLETALNSGTNLDAVYRKWLQHRVKAVRILTEQTDVVCADSLDIVIKTELSKPRTAFVTTKELFAIDWPKFQNFMTEFKEHVKFAHSCDLEDRSLRTFQGFYITGRLAGSKPELILKRIRGLMSSGIHSLWEKWDKYRLAFNLPKATTQNVGVPLSLTDSDVRIWFLLLSFCSFVAGLVFGLEILTKCVTALASHQLC